MIENLLLSHVASRAVLRIIRERVVLSVYSEPHWVLTIRLNFKKVFSPSKIIH